MAHISDQMQECIKECANCHQICLSTSRHCLEKGGRHAEADHVTLLLDCAQVCATSADFMLRGSTLHAETCRACAVVCERCAQDCEKMGDDPMMRQCAETCRRCAKSCQQMAGAA